MEQLTVIKTINKWVTPSYGFDKWVQLEIGDIYTHDKAHPKKYGKRYRNTTGGKTNSFIATYFDDLGGLDKFFTIKTTGNE